MKFSKALILAAFSAAAALTFSACGAGGLLSPKAPELNKKFEMTAEVTCGNSSFTANFSRLNVGSWEVTVTDPYEVQGLSFAYSGGTASASFDGIAAEQLTDDFASSPAGKVISAVENAVQDKTASVSFSDDGLIVQSGECIMAFSEGSSVPSALDLPQSRISAKITDFKVTGEIFPDGVDVIVNE